MIQISGGTLQRRKLKWPKSQTIRPTSTKIREAVFQVIGSLEGEVFWDLCAGSGAMGFEALSRGASEVFFVEKDRQALNCIRENLRTFKLTAQVRGQSVLDFVRKYKGSPAHVIFCDPPYESPVYGPLFMLLDQPQPFYRQNTLIIIEHRKQFKLPEAQHLKPIECRQYGDTHITIYEASHG